MKYLLIAYFAGQLLGTYPVVFDSMEACQQELAVQRIEFDKNPTTQQYDLACEPSSDGINPDNPN
jgi:hypothetical protein